MGIAERKERQKVELQHEVLAAAEELFVKDGYQNVSMRKIAEKIEYSPTTLYRLFKNKAEIMNHLIVAGYEGVYQTYERILSRPHDSPLATLNEILSAYIEFSIAHPNHYELWFATSEIKALNGQLQMSHGDIRFRVYHVWTEQIDRCRDMGHFTGRETLTVFQLLWGAVHGLVSLRIHHTRFPWLPLKQHVAELLDVLNKGLAG